MSAVEDGQITSLLTLPAASPYMTIFKVQNGTSDATPFVLYPTNKTVWVVSVKFGNPFSSKIINFTLANQPSNSTWKTILELPNVIVSSIIADKQGRVWFAKNATLSYYDPISKTAFDTVRYPGDNPLYLALDQNNRIWLTLVNTNRIGMYDPATGQNETYPVPTPAAILQGITVAPDGMVWFTEPRTKALARLNPATKTITEYPSPLNLISPLQLTVDPSGTVWFTDHSTKEFGSFNPQTGEWNKYPVGYCPDSCSLALPNAIATDHQGKVWFSEHFTGRIARYDQTTGILTEYIIPAPTTALAWWAWPGPNNLVWFTSFARGQIGYVNASVVVPVSMIVDRELTIPRGWAGVLPVTVSYNGQSTVSVGVSPTARDSGSTGPVFLTGSYTQGISLNNSTSRVGVTISASPSTALGKHQVTITALDGFVATSVPVTVTITDNLLPYATIALALSLPLEGAVLYIRRRRETGVNLGSPTRPGP